MRHKAFVLIELVVVLAMIGGLIGLTVINVFGSRHSASLTAVTDTLISDLTTQQNKAMSSVINGGAVASSFGVHFDANRYVLFEGSVYNPGASSNSQVPLDPRMSFSPILFPEGNVIFASRSGEIIGYVPGSDRVTVTLLDNVNSKTIQLNRYGVIVSAN